MDEVKNANIQKGRGCENCNGSGHRGRMGIFEIFVVEDEARKLIYDQVPTTVLRAARPRDGHAHACARTASARCWPA